MSAEPIDINTAIAAAAILDSPSVPATPSPRATESIPHSVYDSAAQHVRTHLGPSATLPSVALMCGRGLQGIAEKLDGPTISVPYASIPGFAVSATKKRSAGQLVFGEIRGTPVVCVVGRCHFYEGFSMQQCTFPVRVLALLGVRTLIVTTAVSALDTEKFDLGDLVLVRDHISLPMLAGLNPLVGPNYERLGPRMPSMYNAYDFVLRKKAFMALFQDEALQRRGVRMREAVFCHTAGPLSETRAECQALRALGAEVVAPSTVPEVVAAHHAGMHILCLGLVTSVAAKGGEPCAEEAARMALAGASVPKQPKGSDAGADDDGFLTRAESVKKGGQRTGDLNALVQRIIEML
ncbi:Purine nucleoside phosphorylase [Coemansia sp. Benny D115]|nr:Purine nucleoside phosphorylase [Coemansia sp. Benny D115]